MWDFIPEQNVSEAFQVPDLEDARADFAPFYRTSKTQTQAEDQVRSEMAKLGAGVTSFIAGHFVVGKRKRYGFVIRFMWNGLPGVIRVAGLPMRTETSKKIQQARTQALLNVAEWFKAMVTARIFTPEWSPFLPYLLVDGDKTMLDVIQERNLLPDGQE